MSDAAAQRTADLATSSRPSGAEVLSEPVTSAPGAQDAASNGPSPHARCVASVTGAESPRAGRVSYTRIRLAKLSSSEFARVFEEMGEVMLGATSTNGDDWAARDWPLRRNRLRADATVYLARDGERLVGFLAFHVVPLDGRECIHLMAAYIHPDYQSRGVGHSMNARACLRVLARRPWSPPFVAADVLSPIAFAAWRNRVGDPCEVFPALGYNAIDPKLVSIATVFASRQYPALEFDPCTGRLASKTLPRMPTDCWSGDEEVDGLFRHTVDPGAGDTILMVANFNRRTLARSTRTVLSAIPRAMSRGIRPRTKRRLTDVRD